MVPKLANASDGPSTTRYSITTCIIYFMKVGKFFFA